MKIATYEADDNSGQCEVVMDLKNEEVELRYYDSNHKMYYSEGLSNVSVAEAKERAMRWSIGEITIDG